MEIWVITRPSVHASAIQDGFIGAPLSLNTGATVHAAPVPHRVVDLFSAMLRRPFSDMCCALLRCSGVMCAVCGCKSIIHRHMRSSLWNLSIIDSASPTVGMVRGPSISVTHYWAWVCVCVCVLASIWVCMLMWKRDLKEVGERLIMWGKEHGAVQCKVQPPSLSPSLFFKYLPHGFVRETKELCSPLSLPRSHPSLPPTFFISLAAFLSFSILWLSLPAPWLFCSIAKMGPQSVALEPLNCSEWPRQYARLIYDFSFTFPPYSERSEQSRAAVMLPRCICWLAQP